MARVARRRRVFELCVLLGAGLVRRYSPFVLLWLGREIELIKFLFDLVGRLFEHLKTVVEVVGLFFDFGFLPFRLLLPLGQLFLFFYEHGLALLKKVLAGLITSVGAGGSLSTFGQGMCRWLRGQGLLGWLRNLGLMVRFDGGLYEYACLFSNLHSLLEVRPVLRTLVQTLHRRLSLFYLMLVALAVLCDLTFQVLNPLLQFSKVDPNCAHGSGLGDGRVYRF